MLGGRLLKVWWWWSVGICGVVAVTVRSFLLRLGGLKVQLAQGDCVGKFEVRGNGRVLW